MKEKTLVILAAGMGSRFGGLKQIEPIGPSGEIIADYSIYDAIKNGFTKVVFVIKKENLAYFQNNIVSKYKNKIKVDFAFQSLDNIANISKDRVKPLGTAHALLVSQNKVNTGFVMINADDFYGQEAFKIASHFLDTTKEDNKYLTVNYLFKDACSKKGSVNRAIVSSKDGYVISLDEASMEIKGNKVLAKYKDQNTKKYVSLDQAVALNFFAFKPSIYKILSKEYELFTSKPILDTAEFLLTDVLKKYLANGKIKFKAINTSSKWLGVTYRDDLEEVKEEIKNLVDKGEYPDNLWK